MTQRQPSIEKLFPLDAQNGPYRFSSKQASRIIETALDTWEQDSAVPIKRRTSRKLIFLAAAAITVSGAAAATIYEWQISKENTVLKPSTVKAPQLNEHHLNIIKKKSIPEEVKIEVPEDNRFDKPRKRTVQAEDLLQRANRFRREGKWQLAEQTYTRVYLRYPYSMSAYVARVAAASIQLEHLNNPQAALKLYNKAIISNPRGILDLEARHGMAKSYRRLGDSDGERTALRELLKNHTKGPAVRNARRRLEAIDGEAE